MKTVNGKKNIIILGPPPLVPGGVSTVVRNYLKSDLRSLFNISYMRTGTHKGGALRDNLVEVFYHNAVQLISYFMIIVRKKIDIVHIHTSSWNGFWRFSIFVLISKIINQKVILHIHGAEFKTFFSVSGKFGRSLIKNILETCDCIIVLSKMWKSFFYSIAPKSKISIIPNTVHMPKLSNKKGERKLVKIMFLGGLVRRKGILELMNVSRKLILENNNIEIFIGGFAGLSELDVVDSLNEMAHDLKIQERFSFKMNLSEKEKDDLFKTSDIFVLQSVDEGLPLGLLEAMSYSIPVITTAVGGIPELVTDLENGFIIAHSNEQELYEKIIYLASEKSLRESMGKSNRLKIGQQYSPLVMVSKTKKIYDNLFL